MWIKNKVEELTNTYKTNDPFELAEKLDIEVVLEPLDSINILGICMQIEDQKVIVCNSFLAPASRVVIVAHELGHAIIHPGLSLFFMQENTLFPSGKFENQANRFAAELIIPDKMLEQYKGYKIPEIASLENIHPRLFEYKKLDPPKADFKKTF